MRKKIRGTFTIEAAVIVPVLLMIFALIITLLFYYHDKNVVASIAHETIVYGCGKEETSKEKLEQHFQKRIRGKLLLFASVRTEVLVEENEITIVCTAQKNRMTLKHEMKMNKTEPEKYIRNFRWLKRSVEE